MDKEEEERHSLVPSWAGWGGPNKAGPAGRRTGWRSQASWRWFIMIALIIVTQKLGQNGKHGRNCQRPTTRVWQTKIRCERLTVTGHQRNAGGWAGMAVAVLQGSLKQGNTDRGLVCGGCDGLVEGPALQ